MLKRQFLVCVCALALVAYDDRLPARQTDLDLDLEHLWLLRAAMRRLQDDPATGHASEVLFEFGDLASHPSLDCLALLDAVKMDLERRVHGQPFP
jgi:hypothetical protein